MIKDEIRNIATGKKDLRNFGILIGGVFFLIGVLLLWKHGDAYPYFLVLGILLVGLGFTIPAILRYPYMTWMIFSVLLGWVMTKIILGLLFFLVITPIALISRFLGTRYLDMTWHSNYTTYWVRRDKTEQDSEAHERQY